MATSYNGWTATQTGEGIDRSFTAAGQKFPGGVRAGSVATIFRWLIEKLNTIEPIVAGWNWGYEYRANVNNPSTLSCHSSGTAIDYNAPNHPNGGRGTWSADEVKAIRGWLAQLDGVVRWGYDFTGTKDEMHFEIIGDSASVDRVAAKLGRTPEKPNPNPTPVPRPSLEGQTMIVRRDEFGVDYMWTDSYGPSAYAEIIPKKEDYDLLYALGTVDKPHGEAVRLDRATIRWQFEKIEASGGTIGQGGEKPPKA